MLKFDTAKNQLIKLRETNLVEESILERYDFQEAIVKSWQQFCSELGMGELYFVDSEVIPHSSCRDSIDILALDWEGTPVVIELKRAKHKLQLLQALSYAAMLSTWSSEDYLKRLKDKPCYDDVACLIEGIDEMQSPRIVLVAEEYDPEVILTADFLGNHNVDITAIAVSLVKHNDEILLSLDRKYPLSGLEDTYVPRARTKRSDPEKTIDSTWDDVVKWSKCTWVMHAIEQFRKHGFGGENPGRRGFGGKRNTALGNIFSVGFRSDHMVVHVLEQSQSSSDRIEKIMELPLEPWGREGDRRSGWAFRVRNETDYHKFISAIQSV